MKLMHLDQEHLGIPETDYACIVRMPSSEFARICRNLSQFGDSMIISCNKAGKSFKFSHHMTKSNFLVLMQVFHCFKRFSSFPHQRRYKIHNQGWCDGKWKIDANTSHWQGRKGGDHRNVRTSYTNICMQLFEFIRKGFTVVHSSSAVNVTQCSVGCWIYASRSWLRSILFGTENRRLSKLNHHCLLLTIILYKFEKEEEEKSE